MTMACVPRLPKNANVEWHVVVKERRANVASNGKISVLVNICNALRDLVPFVQFKKREKYP